MATRAWLEAIGTQGAWGDHAERHLAALEQALAHAPAAPPPAALVYTGPRRAPAQAHLEGLRFALGPDAGAATRERRGYHARWLLHLLAPDDPCSAPLVSVVIPSRDDGALLVEAVQSALAQSHPRIEVIVVDDGSREPADAALAALSNADAGRVRVVRQAPLGVAAARNRGIDEARGELVHFLDADDLLHPDAVARKLAALRAAPDAELVCSGFEALGDGGEDARHGGRFGDELCPTRDLLASCAADYPFHTSSVLAPRWLWREIGAFDPALDQSEDVELWLRLALRGTCVAALDAPLHQRRFHAASFTRRSPDRWRWLALVTTRALAALLARSAHWLYVPATAARLRWQAESCLGDEAGPDLCGARDALLAAIAELGNGEPRDGHSPRPVLGAFHHLLAAPGAPGSAWCEQLRSTLAAARRNAPPPGPSDVELWFGAAAPHGLRHQNRGALKEVLAWLDRSASRGRLPVERSALIALAGHVDTGRLGLRLTALARTPRLVPTRLAWRLARWKTHAERRA